MVKARTGETRMIGSGKNYRVRLAGAALSLVLGILITAGAATIARGEISCTASVDRTSVPVGGYLILTVTAEGSVDKYSDFQLPAMDGVTIGEGLTSSRRLNFNGKISNTENRTFYLYVEKKNDFVIGKIKVVSGQDSAESEPISITVTIPDPTSGVPTTNSGNRVRQPSTSTQRTPSSQNENIFVTLEVDHDQVWVGQQIILSFKYWHRGQSWSDPSYQAPKTEGFWRENLGPERSFRQSHNGWVYNVTEIKYAIFPTRSGTLNIEPAVLGFSGSSGRFFGSRRRTQAPQTYKTDAIPIQVKPLPLPRPAVFSGIAGKSLDLTAKMNRSDVPVGESVTYSVEILTDGFLKGFAGLEVLEPEGTRLHDGAEQLETLLGRTGQNNIQKLVGRYSQENFIVPGHEGLLEIPPLEVSWFNVVSGQYEIARTNSQNVNVTRGRAGSGENESSGFMRSEIERLGQDLAFIRQAPDDLAMAGPALPQSAIYWFGLILPLIGLGSWRFFVNKLASDRRNPGVVRRRQALSVALNSLDKSVEITSIEDRFGAISRSVTRYVADVLNRPLASISAQDVREFCSDLNLYDHGVRLANFLQDSNSARYGGVGVSLDTSAEEVKVWLKDLDSAFRKKAAENKSNIPGKVLPLLILAGLGIGMTGPTLAADSQNTRPGADPVRLLAEGNHAYTTGEISEAVDLYSQALELGAHDPILYYNLGNAYARQGQLGQAVVSYLRARRLSPTDNDINGNLAWIRLQLKDLELQDSSLPLFIAQVVTVIGWLTLNQWSIIPLILVWILAVQIGLAWYRGETNNNLRRLIIGTMALLFLSTGITSWRYYLEEVRDQAVIIVSEASVYSGPADSYPVLFEVHDGLTVNLNEYRDGWVRMDLGGQWQGWVPVTSVETVRRTITE
jgi:tetratricopeptide (TPR) repeat protein